MLEFSHPTQARLKISARKRIVGTEQVRPYITSW